MKLGKGIIWGAIVVIMALLAGFLHIKAPFSFPWGMLSAAIAYFTVRRVDLSQSRFLPVLVKLEKYRLPALAIAMPLSLILLPLANQSWAFWAGISAVFVTICIMISYTLPVTTRQ